MSERSKVVQKSLNVIYTNFIKSCDETLQKFTNERFMTVHRETKTLPGRTVKRPPIRWTTGNPKLFNPVVSSSKLHQRNSVKLLS